MSVQAGSIWEDSDVRPVYDLADGQIDRNNPLLWDQYLGPADAVGAVAEWVVATIERQWVGTGRQLDSPGPVSQQRLGACRRGRWGSSTQPRNRAVRVWRWI